MNIDRRHLGVGALVHTGPMYPIPQNSVLQYASGGITYQGGLPIDGISYGLSGLGQLVTSGGAGTGLFGTGLFASTDIATWGVGEWALAAVGAVMAFSTVEMLAGKRRR